MTAISIIRKKNAAALASSPVPLRAARVVNLVLKSEGYSKPLSAAGMLRRHHVAVALAGEAGRIWHRVSRGIYSLKKEGGAV